MKQHYNAFISYRHAPLDSKVAGEIHRQLEHFRIPRAIRAQTGIQKIDRIFRDKEELPITSDLNDDIAQALRDSDYLIVICSPRTGESLWVQKEIETFLTSHGRSRVLTVLAEGEPGDVIPEILRTDVVTDRETGEERTVPVEPLSCDYRLRRHKARKVELPRLAAAILGCGYDALRQRQKLYRTRRLTALMAAMLVFAVCMTAYFVWSNGRIQENYRMALENQSVYLASESQQALERGDRITAIQLAMAAMPDENRSRPLTTEAELALSRAISAYAYQYSGANGVLQTDLYSNGGVQLTDFWMNDDHDILVTGDGQSMIKAIDTATHALLWQTEADGYGTFGGDSTVMMLPGDRLLIREGALFTCHDLRTGGTLWEHREDGAIARSCAVTPRGDRLLILSSDEAACIDASSGEELWRSECPMYRDGEREIAPRIEFLSESSFSPDGGAVLFAAAVTSGGTACQCGLSLDLDDRSWTYFDGTYREILDGCMPDRETAVILAYPDSGEAVYARPSVNREQRAVLCCEDRRSESPLWTAELTHYAASQYETVRLCGDGELFCSVANVCCRVDPKTGEVFGRNEMNSPVLDIILQDDAGITAILDDGSAGVYDFEKQTAACSRLFGEGVQKVCCWLETNDFGELAPRYFVMAEDADAVESYFTGTIIDMDYRSLGVGFDFMGVTTSLCGGDLIAGVYRSLYSIDPEAGVVRWAVSLDDLGDHEDYTRLEPAGCTADQSKVIVRLDSDGTLFGAVDAETGALEEHRLMWDEECGHSAVCLIGDKLCAVERSFARQEDRLFLYDITTGETDRRPLPTFEDSSLLAVSPCGGRMIIQGEGKACLIDPVSLELTDIAPEALPEADGAGIRAIRDIGQGLLGYTDGCDVVLIGQDGALRQVITMDVPAASAAAVPGQDRLLALGINGQVYVYSSDGERQAVIDLGMPQNVTSGEDVVWQFGSDGRAVMYYSGAAYLINTGTWKLELDLDFCFYVSGDRFFCQRNSADGGALAVVYTRYTPEELLEKGRALVGSLTLRDPEKYGLEGS